MSILHRLRQSWFLACLIVLLPGGMIWGWSTPPQWQQMSFGQINPAAVTILILFLMSFSLDSSRLRDSFRSPGPVLWGTVVNIILIPLMAWPLTMMFSRTDFALGLMITSAIPCTLATASVSTRQASGNDAISLLVTLTTNLLSVVLTPLWLKWTISVEAEINPWPVILNLAATVLLPTGLGQGVRSWERFERFASRYKSQISIAAQSLVLLIVTKAAVEGGGRLQAHATWPSAMDFLILALACGGLHSAAMLIANIGGRLMGFAIHDRIAVVFAGSQKTLPVGLLVAAMPAITAGLPLPFLTFPILLFHAVQLLMDSAIADQIRKRLPSVQN